VDYKEILEAAEKEADIVVWDGGNNDFPFYQPTVHIVLVDPHRAGHELKYYPGTTNVRMADIAIVSKVNTAKPEDVERTIENVKTLNPTARIFKANILIKAETEEGIEGKRVLVVEDGPTVTHGGMSYGAATIKAKELGAEIVDPRPYAAVGYSENQMDELSKVVNDTPCDLVLLGTPTDIRRYLKVDKPVVRVRYELEEIVPGEIEGAIFDLLPEVP
jgi:predicted GTPase